MTERYILRDLKKCIQDTKPLTDAQIDTIANQEVANFGNWFEKYGKSQIQEVINSLDDGIDPLDILESGSYSYYFSHFLRVDNYKPNSFWSKYFGAGQNWHNMLYVDSNCPVMLNNKDRIAGALNNKIDAYCKTHKELRSCEFVNLRDSYNTSQDWDSYGVRAWVKHNPEI